MGFALARVCADAGAEVTLVAGPVTLATPRGVRRIDVQSAMQMRDAVMQAVPGQDVFIAVAAVADYRPRNASEHKIKKGSASVTLELEANPDILSEVAAQPHAPLCVGFAAESRDLATYAEGKRIAKKLALVVGNLVQDGLGGDTNSVTLFDETGSYGLPPADKSEVARGIVEHIVRLLEGTNEQH
jgi:phosphopantothenoylcysteine decarboxylase/phosphopantothenate--cysteine ligase